MHFAPKISAKPFPGLRVKTFPVLLVVIFMTTQECFAQFTDDFSDGDLSANPAWIGSAKDFRINSLAQLQLNAAVAGTSALITDMPSKTGGTVWELFVGQSFSPSGANHARVYLSSDTPDLTAPLNGYFLQLGEAGSDDAVELFRQTGTAITSVCRASTAAIANPFNIRVKVIRTDPGKWELFIDYSGKADFVLEATGVDDAHPATGFFGLRCTYTITNATRFFFDDISVKGFDLPDSTPPHIGAVDVISSSSLKLVFSEAVDPSSINTGNFFVDLDYASRVELKDDQRTLLLEFSKPFVNGREATLRVENVRDLAGNSIASTEVAFLYFVEWPTGYRDVIITEIFADPSPKIGLPDAEFIELYNRSPNPVDLADWTLSDENTSARFGRFILLPGSYLIVTSADAIDAYPPTAAIVGLSSFPALNNTGDILSLKDNHRSTIDSLNYNVSWYRDDDKSDGGWALELIDINNICDNEQNWTASEEVTGGTPGEENSVFATRPDNIGPSLVSVVLLDSLTIHISFDEKLDADLPDLRQFQIEPRKNIRALEFDPSLSGFIVHLADSIERGLEYTLTVTDIYDCPGNKIQDSQRSAFFLLPESVQPGDIVLNEILFNPHPTGVDFIELYNGSTKTLDMQGWSLRNHLSGEKVFTITSDHILFRPGEYRVITEDGNKLKGEYLAAVESTFLETDVPALNDNDGSVVIMDGKAKVLDSIAYDNKMHTAFLKDDEGVSIERISFLSSSFDRSNWRSANSTTGFATPGYANSNARLSSSVHDEAVVVEPEVIQHQVTTRDFARIKYKFDHGGFMANVRIFDQQGRSIREIAANETLGTEGFFRWDGDRDNGALVTRGYYLVWFEVFDTSGVLKSFRKRIVVF